MTHYNISVTSDTVCPWCYIGHRRLQKAIDQHKSKNPSDTFSTGWHAFQLNPDAPNTSVPKRQYYEAKFGAAAVEPIFARMDGVGKQEGIKFNNDGKTGNTRDSHRLIEHAGQQGEEMQTKVVEALFTAYFEEGGDITSHAVLRDAAIKAGLSKEKVDGVLNSDEGGKVVDEEAGEARANGVNGVPYFTINDMFAVEGAQEAPAFNQLFDRIKQKSKV